MPIDPQTTLLLSATGNMFDDWEVPALAREAIFEYVRGIETAAVLCESRAETLTGECVGRFAQVFDDRLTGIGIGVESANPGILKFCVNKELDLGVFRDAVGLMAEHNVQSTANVLLGIPFLSEDESIRDASSSLISVLDLGADQGILFPVLVRPHTVVGWLWEHGLYEPSSLWSLVEVLLRLGPERARHVTISWYKDYYAGDIREEELGSLPVLAAPTTCPSCIDRVMSHLDAYRDSGDFGVVRTLDSLSCACHDAWRERVSRPQGVALPARLIESYELMARGVLGDAWWEEHGTLVAQDVTASKPSAGY